MVLSYCTNVHPAEDLPGILAQLDRYAGPVRDRLGQDRLGVGLWLAAEVAGHLAADPARLTRLRAELDARGLDVVTLNAFPYGGFHDAVVKHQVFAPPWTDPRRLRYTLDCARVLAALVPADAGHGSISTLPLGWREPWSEQDDAVATAAFVELTTRLRELAGEAPPIRIAVEPEPGSRLDAVSDAVRWLAGRVDPAHVGLCLDTCHLAVSWAEPAAAVRAIGAAGLDVVKVQVSAALEVPNPAAPGTRSALAAFAEPRYLHQVRERTGDGRVLRVDDLPAAFTELPAEGPWRVHFHVPLHATPAPPLASTTPVLLAATAALDELPQSHPPHLEVETYTWGVLPSTALGGGRPDRPTGVSSSGHDLVEGIAAELDWARDNLIRAPHRAPRRTPPSGEPKEAAW